MTCLRSPLLHTLRALLVGSWFNCLVNNGHMHPTMAYSAPSCPKIFGWIISILSSATPRFLSGLGVTRPPSLNGITSRTLEPESSDVGGETF